MSIDIRLPNITGVTEAEQLVQIRSYLYQFAEQLQWAFNTIESGNSSQDIVLQDSSGGLVEKKKTDTETAHMTFNSIKDLIIKSADIVEAYSEKIDKLLDLKSTYLAISDFGTYTEENNNKWSAYPQYIEGKFIKTETINGELVQEEFDLKDIDSRVRKMEGTIRVGQVGSYLSDRDEEIGIEICATDEFNEETKKRYAVFTSCGLELYDGTTSTKPVAYISKNKLYITNAEFTGEVKMGKYTLDFSSGIKFKWGEE